MEFLNYVDFSTKENTIQQVKNSLQHYKVTLLKNIPDAIDKRSYFETLADSIGQYYDVSEDLGSGEIQNGRWVDITFDPQFPDRYRSSKTRFHLHTDGSYYPIENNMQYFYCEAMAAVGGATTFIDTRMLVDLLLLDEQQELLNRLQSVAVCFSKFERKKTRPILLKEGDDWRINYNYNRIDAANTEEAKKTALDFFDFLETRVQEAGVVTAVKLQPGEAVFFNDERILHGRNAFFADRAGERRLVKGTILNWQETPVLF